MRDKLRSMLEHKVPTDTARQVDVYEMMELNRESFAGKIDVLDLGSGTGDAFEPLKSVMPDLSYVGLDIEHSAEVDDRVRSDLTFKTYDGRTIPFADNSFEVVFCRQVLEHVRYPDDVIAEVSRVLKKDGVFVGSVSQLEPYHSHSIFNWTAYAIVEVFESHGLTVRQLRPGIDGITLSMARIMKKARFDTFFSFESIFNHFLDGTLREESVWERNFMKLIIAGHIIWLAQKTE